MADRQVFERADIVGSFNCRKDAGAIKKKKKVMQKRMGMIFGWWAERRQNIKTIFKKKAEMKGVHTFFQKLMHKIKPCYV